MTKYEKWGMPAGVYQDTNLFKVNINIKIRDTGKLVSTTDNRSDESERFMKNKRGETQYVVYLDEAAYISDSNIPDGYDDSDDGSIIVEENTYNNLHRFMDNWIKSSTPTEEDIEAYWDEVKDNIVDFLSSYSFIADKEDIDIVDNTVYIKKIKIKKTADTIKLNIPLENIEQDEEYYYLKDGKMSLIPEIVEEVNEDGTDVKGTIGSFS